jgi:transcriptional regulator with GAF, ATPase, and Fis domain
LKTPAAEEQNRAPEELTPEAIRAALELHDRSVTRAARELGLKNRDVLYRLMKKYGIKQAEDG